MGSPSISRRDSTTDAAKPALSLEDKWESVTIPQLSEFGLDGKTGFLGKQPLRRLPNPYFAPWEKTLEDLSHLLVAWKLRDHLLRVSY